MPQQTGNFPTTVPDETGPRSATDPEAFSLLGDETRLRILFALHDPAVETPIEFSNLYERIDAEFTSGFNYHLDKLVPKFVSKTADGYDLTTYGGRVARAVAAGTFADQRELDWFDVDGECVVCGDSTLRASYEEERFLIECAACEELIVAIETPPNLVRNEGPAELVDAVDAWMHHWMRMCLGLARSGICDYCGGDVESSLVEDVSNYDRIDILFRFECTDCGEIRRATVGSVASQHPDVREFHASHGLTLRNRRYWTVDHWLTDNNVTITSRNPWRFEVTFDVDGDDCVVTVTGEPKVIDVSR